MTTTDHFQKLPTFYRSRKECPENYNKPSTNPRYPNFTQFCFTAGDVDQFQTYRDPTNGKDGNDGNDGKDEKDGNDENNINSNPWYTKVSPPVGENADWMRYRNINTESVDSTFRYLFEKFKKGLFIKIKDNKLAVFLPFSKHDYVNEWGAYMKHPPQFKSMTDFLIYASKIQGYDVKEYQINKFPSRWYGNNCLVRPEFPIGENDRGLPNIKDMLETLCNERKVPDIELFINKRDFPLIRQGRNEPYEHIFGSENYPLISHRYETYCPILSMVTTSVNADIPMPTAEDWARVSSQESDKYFAPDCRDYNYDFSLDWSSRIPTAIFRGASTGCGVTMDTNPRLMLSYLSTVSPIDGGIKLLDAGITKWNLRPRKHISSEFLQVIDKTKLPFGLVAPLSPDQQSRYKYIVHVDGHVSAFRLSLELSMGSVILLVESKYRLWFRRYLKEYVHYVPVLPDLSNLFDQIRWCRQNDEKCKKIADNAKKFYDTFLKKKGILDYLQILFINMKSVTGSYFYNSIQVSDIIREWQLSRIFSVQQSENLGEISEISEISSDLLNFSNASNFSNFSNIKDILTSRNYYAMEGMSMVIRDMRYIQDEVAEENILHKNRDTFVYTNQGQTIVVKKTDRTNELINEAFCGLTTINKLIEEIPNFRYTYFFNNTLLSEYIHGVTFKKFIEDGCDMQTFTVILAMLSMALAVAQERYGFVHYDLYPWNIIITTLDAPRTITYRFGRNVFTVTTRIIPVIIDYGRSHIIVKAEDDYIHSGTIEPFKSSVFQDCFSIIVSSVHEMMTALQKTRTNITSQIDYLIYLVNFFSKTAFQPDPLSTYHDLVKFVAVHKKYNEMIYGNKCDLEKKDPLEMFFYIASGPYGHALHSSISQIVYPKTAEISYDFQQPSFYYDFILGNPPKIEEYLATIETKCDSLLEKKDMDELSLTYACNMITLAAKGCLSFCEKVGIPQIKIKKSVDVIASKMKEWHSQYSQDSYKPLRIRVHSPENDMLCLAKYDTKTFSIPGRILTILQGNFTKKDENLLSFRNMFVFSSLYTTPYRVSPSFYSAFSGILKVSPLVILNHNANLNTLKMISSVIYENDKKELEKMRDPPQKILFLIENIQGIL
jgi:hypothetical protein